MPKKNQTVKTTKLSDLQLHTQYIKEISLKIPAAPYIFENIPPSPNLTVTVDVNAQQLVEEQPNFEVTVFISCVSTITDDNLTNSIFNLHLQYAGMVTFPTLETSNLEDLLMVHTPDLLFPEIRNTVLNITRSANLPPVTLQRIDFATMWKEKKETSPE
ncbi:Preprotein translocase subunit SecB (SecB) (PDB:1OZB) [Commensalibacter communis]|uniref:protein-export chaperone SecB n=1 Tax=Commensalibacter communis TaxID=2972786 RepID=UPI0022FF9B6A|nr:protein-export chaperone SecB [Commensalibacter communis]CAI3938049.1 Preprotein translocase subunit SecB (SecB) (PDB:1OZB) [Commensalibacter communis]